MSNADNGVNDNKKGAKIPEPGKKSHQGPLGIKSSMLTTRAIGWPAKK